MFMKKKAFILSLLTGLTTALTALVVVGMYNETSVFALNKGESGVWVHYAEALPGTVQGTEKGIRNYYVQCGGDYQFEVPASYVEGGAYDISEFAEDDPRYFTLNPNTVDKFDYVHDLTRLSKWGDSTLSISKEIKHGSDLGSLEYKINSAHDYDYLTLKAPYLTDITSYDYIHFYVYNPTEHNATITLLWCGDTTLYANQWTEVIFTKSLIESGVTDVQGHVIPSNNITNLSFVLWFNQGFEAGDALYFSSIEAVSITEIVIQDFDQPTGVENINVFSGSSTISYDSSIKYGTESGSLKVVHDKPGESWGETYLALTSPKVKDISSFSYIAFRVYNANAYDISVGVMWAKDTVVPANSWAEVKITVAEFDGLNIQTIAGTDISTTDITGFAIRLMGGWSTENSIAYISNVIVYK